MELFLHHDNDKVRTDSDADLRLDGVGRLSPERGDLEMPLEPLEEQLNVPAVLVEIGDRLWVSVEIVGQENVVGPDLVFDQI